MRTTTHHPVRSTSAAIVLSLALAGLTAVVSPVTAAPADDRILAEAQYTSDKARTLARTYAQNLRKLNAAIYHCMPWVEVHKHSIGFFRPKHADGDQRYLAVRLFVEQDPSPQFAALAVEERASSMFSRYVGPVLRRMAAQGPFLSDPAVDGFTIIVEWQKQAPHNGGRAVHETIAVFVDRATAGEFVGNAMAARTLASRTRVLAFDGDTALGPVRLTAWDDDFVATHKVKNYQPAPGVTCH
jgi:hypothetical protein